MIYNEEDISRLIPEAFIPLQMWPTNGARFVVADTLLFTNFGPGKLILDTRRQLEIAREGLRLIECNDVNPKTSEVTTLQRQVRMGRIARETLAAIEGVTK